MFHYLFSRGTLICNAWAASKDVIDCPSRKALNWNYWSGKSWVPAANGLSIVADYQNIGEDCWGGCELKQGNCNWCGTRGICCRKDWHDKSNGCNGKFEIDHHGHSCVPGPRYIPGVGTINA